MFLSKSLAHNRGMRLRLSIIPLESGLRELFFCLELLVDEGQGRTDNCDFYLSNIWRGFLGQLFFLFSPELVRLKEIVLAHGLLAEALLLLAL